MDSSIDGCALCGSTWGNYWAETGGRRLFFCCDVCSKQYSAIVSEAKRRKDWDSVDQVVMLGDHRGRTCKVTRGTDTYSFMISFFDDGSLRSFLELS